MSAPLRTAQFVDPLGAFIYDAAGNVLMGQGNTPPADNTPGYAVGALWFDLDAAAGSEWLRNDGTATACAFKVLNGGVNLSTLTTTAAELNLLHSPNLSVGPAAGITGGTGTVTANVLNKQGSRFITRFFVDLTGLGSSTTDLDIIGQGASAAYIMQLVAADVGATIDAIEVKCLEAPATGVTDIDLYSATEATGKFDDAVTGLTETALLTSGGAWTNGRMLGATTCPAAGEYLYLTCGAAGVPGTYTAGKFEITVYGR